MQERQTRRLRRRAKAPQEGGGWLLLRRQALACVLAAAVLAAGQGLGGVARDQSRQVCRVLSGRQEAPLPQVPLRQWGEELEDWVDQLGEELLERVQGLLRQGIELEEESAVPSPGLEAEGGQGGGLFSAAQGQLPESCTTQALHWPEPLWTPVTGWVTSFYGYREHPITGEEDFHTGVDIAAAEGTAIQAVLPGTVVEAGWSEVYGNRIVLEHEGGLRTIYCHCSRLLAQEGTVVAQGDRIALVGSTGWSTGPHLHLEAEVDGQREDPLPALPHQWVPQEQA